MSVAVTFETVAQMFDAVTRKYADESHPMLMQKVSGKYEGLMHSECRLLASQFGNGLASLGVRHGDMVALISENRTEWVVADMGMVQLGAVNVSIFPTSTARQIEFIFNDAGVTYAIVSNQLQLNKVLKIASETKTLKKIILISEKGVSEDDRIIYYSSVLRAGKDFAQQHPEFLSASSSRISPDDLLTLIYTSGTTGNPKGVMLTHRNLVSNMVAAAECIPFVHEDTLLSFLPLCHSYERMAGYYTAIACGATIAYAESIDSVRENLMEVRPTVVTTVPRLFERIHSRLMKQIGNEPPIRQKIFHWAVGVGRKYASARKGGGASPFLSLKHAVADALVFKKIRQRTGGRLKYFVSGGAALSKELGEFFEAVGIQILEGYGMTESSPVISVNRLEEYKFGTVGKPIPGVTVKIAGDGEILVKGPNVMKGYWQNPEATNEAIDPEGWLHTGDIGTFDEEGFLVITDRKKHLFVSSGGKNIAPQPIESLFLESKYIDQFVLIGDGRMYLTALIIPDFESLKEIALEQKLAHLSEEELVTRESIIRHFDTEIARMQVDLAPYERIRRFTLLPTPFTIESGELTPTMKVRRKVVHEKYKHHIDRMYEGVS